MCSLKYVHVKKNTKKTILYIYINLHKLFCFRGLMTQSGSTCLLSIFIKEASKPIDSHF